VTKFQRVTTSPQKLIVKTINEGK